MKLIESLYKAVVEKDMALLEINPLVVTKAGKLVCLDAKITFDSNALFRHKDVMDLRDLEEEDPAEVEASKYDLNYVKLDGEIGCMVNGAGLAMATMDIIKLYGSEPANFLDVGGGATKEKVAAAFKIILSDHNVKGILVNIFGGIMRCDIIAEGVWWRQPRRWRSRCRSWCAWKAPTSTSASRSWPSPASRSSRRTTSPMPPRRSPTK